jgi:hypothetical protein
MEQIAGKKRPSFIIPDNGLFPGSDPSGTAFLFSAITREISTGSGRRKTNTMTNEAARKTDMTNHGNDMAGSLFEDANLSIIWSKGGPTIDPIVPPRTTMLIDLALREGGFASAAA